MKNNSNKKSLIKKIRSEYIVKQILEHLNRIRLLAISQYNKKYQKMFDIQKEEYKKESYRIEIEIIPVVDGKGKFINIRKGYEAHFKIYFNYNRQEVNKTKILKKDKVGKIKVVIDYKNNAFYGLFSECKCIKKIKFLKFNRPDIVNLFENRKIFVLISLGIIG